MPTLSIRRRGRAGLAPRRQTEPSPPLVRITSVTLDKRMPVQGVLAGLLSGAVGVCVAFLVSGFSGAIGSPVVAVAQLAIDLSPPPVKNFAIREFGTHDKLVLQIGVLVVLALFAGFVGVLAHRREASGLIGVAIFGAVGLIAAGTRPTATAADLLPSLIGAAAAALALVGLTRAAGPPVSRQASTVPEASLADAAGADQDSRGEPIRSPGQVRAAVLSVSEPPRRQFLTLGAVAAGVAAASYAGGRLLSEQAS